MQPFLCAHVDHCILESWYSINQEKYTLIKQVCKAGCEGFSHSCGRYDFLAREQEVAVLKQLTLEELLNVYKAYLMPLGPERKKLAVHVFGKPFVQELTAAVPDGCLLVPDPAKYWEENGKWDAVVGAVPSIAA